MVPVPNELANLLETVQSGDYYTLEHIPREKLQTAVNLYPVDLGDSPIALVDSTVFGSAKTGLVMGLKGLYWRNDRMNRGSRSFVSWGEVAEHDNTVYRKGSEVQLARGCVFVMAGSSMDKDVLVNLLNRIVELYRDAGTFEAMAGTSVTESTKRSEENSSTESAATSSTYWEIAVDIMAICVTADGRTEDTEVELVTAMIEADDFIEDKALALDALVSRLEANADDWRRSKAVVRLKATALAAKAAKLDQDSKERLVVMLDGILDSAVREDEGATAAVVELMKSKLA